MLLSRMTSDGDSGNAFFPATVPFWDTVSDIAPESTDDATAIFAPGTVRPRA